MIKSVNDKPPLADKRKQPVVSKEEKTISAHQPFQDPKETMENHSTIEDYRFQIDESQSDFDQFNIEDYMKKSQQFE